MRIFKQNLIAGFIILINLLPQTLFAETLISLDEALKNVLPAASDIEKRIIILNPQQKEKIEKDAAVTLHPEYDREFHFYSAKSNTQVVGYAAEDTVQGKWGPIHYLAGFDPQGKITNIVVLSFNERRGRPVAKHRFLSQFIAKTIKDPVHLRKDINGVTGATISSRGITDGIRKLLYIFEEFYKM